MKLQLKYKIVYGVFVLYALLYFLLAKYYLLAIGPDFVSYTAIAEFYAEGEWFKAVNTWWSPLYSWLMAPFLKIGLSALWANKMLHFFVGLYFITVVYKLLSFFLTQVNTFIFLFGFIPFVLYHTLVADTPDTLAAVLLLHFLQLLTGGFSKWNKKTAILLGVVGGLAYLAKSFNFYFIGAGSLVTILLAARYRGLERAILQAIKVAIPFVVICSLWIFFMMLKSDKIQITSRAEPKPCYVDTSYKQGNVYDCAGLGIDEGSKYSNWEQPQLYEMKDFFNGGIEKDKLTEKIWKNLKQYFREYIGYLLMAALLAGIIFFRKKIRTITLLWFAYIGIYLAGHFIFHLEPRFFIMPMVVSNLAVLFIVALLNAKYTTEKYMYIVPILLVFWLARNPILQLSRFKPDAELMKAKELGINHQVYKDKLIAGDYLLFNHTLYFCFFNGCKSLGALSRPYDKWRDMVKLHTVKADALISKDSSGKLILLPLK